MLKNQYHTKVFDTPKVAAEEAVVNDNGEK